MSKTPGKGLSAYEKARLLEAPIRIEPLLGHYDVLRQAAASHDAGSVLSMLERLQQSLNFEANAMFAWRLSQLYAHIRSCVEKQDFQEACRIADELYCMWQHAGAMLDQQNPDLK